MQEKTAVQAVQPVADARRSRRVIRVGDRVVTGVVCPRCVMATVVFPESVLDTHLERHQARESGAANFARYHNRSAGRPVGSKSKMSMSSTGVIHRRGIRGSR